MTNMPLVALALAATALLAHPARSAEFEQLTDEAAFLRLIEGKSLTALGVRLWLSTSGQIEGSAFGRDVTGHWRWENGYFCRDLAYGSTVLDPNCQVVQVKGDVVRFIADEGTGDSADLRLR